MIPGGLTEAKPATPEVQQIANEVSCVSASLVRSKSFTGEKQEHERLNMKYEIMKPHRVKSQLEEKTNESYKDFEAIEYKTQVVAGIIYYIKVRIAEDIYIHIKVLQCLPHQNQPLKLCDYQTDKSKDDEITGF